MRELAPAFSEASLLAPVSRMPCQITRMSTAEFEDYYYDPGAHSPLVTVLVTPERWQESRPTRVSSFFHAVNI